MASETIGFADYRGNRQYITTGNLSENDRAFLFLMDYANRRRVKVWGRTRMVEDPAIIERLMDCPTQRPRSGPCSSKSTPST